MKTHLARSCAEPCPDSVRERVRVRIREVRVELRSDS
jgi:hypothetical protein